MSNDVLVLDERYQPLGRINWQRAICLILEEEVDLLEQYEGEVIRSKHQSWPMPAVVRWKKRIHRRWRGVKFTREGVYERDKGRCAYCGAHVSLETFTFDHVVPRSKGGKTAWENIVACCQECNKRKRDRTPEQAGMHLISPPKRPERGAQYYAVLRKRKKVPKEWKRWLTYADWIAEFYPNTGTDSAPVEGEEAGSP